MGDTLRVFAPATVANVACGFDIFGFALEVPGDEIILRQKGDSVRVTTVTGDEGKLTLDSEKNVAAVSVQHLLNYLGEDRGFEIEVHKKMPLSSGLGSSAASSVGAVFGANLLLNEPLEVKELIPFAMEAERVACGSAHADNVAPALLGGFVLIRSYHPLEVVEVPVNLPLYCTILHPHVEILTKKARDILPKNVPLQDLVTQTGNASALIAALIQGDASLLEHALHDAIIEKVRGPLIPGFDKIKQAAIEAGALGCSISGSGPSIFALTLSENKAKQVGEAMQLACPEKSTLFVSKLNTEGPRVLT
ncbi:MAG: Homoserine kinase [Chlamydiae bacterium]|nr:Homoserine kinase [Chlamydiota bacterium]